MNPNKDIESIIDITDEFAQAHRDLTYLESIKPAIKALEMSKSSQPSISGKEMDAYTSEAYQEFCTQYANAQRIYTSLKLKIETLKLKVDVYRTDAATNRQIEKLTR